MERRFADALRSNQRRRAPLRTGMRSAILKQSPCRTGRRKYGEMDQTSAAVRSTPVPQRNTPGKQVSQAVRTVMGA